MTTSSQTAHESIVRFIAIERTSRDAHFPWKIIFFDDEVGEFAQLNGNLDVPNTGANIRFAKVNTHGGDDYSWDFHALSIHPLGDNTQPVDLQWMVTNDEIKLHDNGIGPKRSFSYTLSVQITESGRNDATNADATNADATNADATNADATTVYFDPQLVNLGGSG